MENKKEMKTWLTDFNLSHPFVIAGPCSAETEEQVLKIAHELKVQTCVLEREFGKNTPRRI
jgi:chorismate mutase